MSAKRTGSKAKIERFFEKNVGRVVTTAQIRELTGVSEYARRIRELRNDDGMQILTHHEREDLALGEYILVSLERKLRPKASPIAPAQIVRLKEALAAYDAANSLYNSRDAYLLELSKWARGERTDKPTKENHGLC